MRVLTFLLLAVVIALIVAGALAYIWWGVWGLVGLFVVVVAGLLILKAMAGRIIQALFLAPFRMKGKVLHGAKLEVHSVSPADAPERHFEEDDEDDMHDADFDSKEEAEEYRREMAEERREAEAAHARRQWFWVDATITPKPQPGNGFQHWDPDDVTLVDAHRRPLRSFDDIDDEDDGDVGVIADVLLWDAADESFGDNEDCKYFGPQRLRMLVGVEPGHTRLAFRYYFEQFGEVTLSGAVLDAGK